MTGQRKTVKNLTDLARVLGVCKNTVESWVKKGMPRRKALKGNRYIYDVQKIQEWRAIRLTGNRGAKPLSLSDKELESMKANVEKQRAAIDFYKVNRADIFANKQINYQKKADYILEQMSDDEIKNAKLTEKLAALKVLDTGAAIFYDKERLERGESTQNVSVLVGAIKELKRKRSEREAIREPSRAEAN